MAKQKATLRQAQGKQEEPLERESKLFCVNTA